MTMNKDTWGYGIPDTYLARWELIRVHLHGSRFVLVDWGSDAGWYSIQVAKAFPQSCVVSVDAGTMLGSHSLVLHQKVIREHGIDNNILVNCLFGPETFAAVRRFPADFQFVLNVFHWMGDGYGSPVNGPDEWDRVFCNLVRGATVTFFEVPNEDHPGETPHRIRDWYRGRKIATVLQDALTRDGLRAKIQLLGELGHGHKGYRPLFKITLDDPVKAADGLEIAAHIKSVGRTIKPTMYRRVRSFVSRLKIKLVG